MYLSRLEENRCSGRVPQYGNCNAIILSSVTSVPQGINCTSFSSSLEWYQTMMNLFDFVAIKSVQHHEAQAICVGEHDKIVKDK